MMRSVGFLPIARETFDISFATARASGALQTLEMAARTEVFGEPTLATDAASVAQRASAIADRRPDVVVVFQATFADSTLIQEAAARLDCPLVLWAVPEDRTGDRLRLNSLCGINLAAYVLARMGIDYRWVYRSETDASAGAELIAAMDGSAPSPAAESPAKKAVGVVEAPSLRGTKVGLIGERPDGFEPCDYDPEMLESRFGVSVDRVELEDLFRAAESGDDSAVAAVRSELSDAMTGLDDVDQDALQSSLRIYLGLTSLVEDRGWNGVATRCWPECFTEFGGAACAGNSMLTSRGVPGCCEADVYGDVTALLLQELAESPPFVADLVDVDRSTNTAAFWHCGLAARELAPNGVKPTATVHSNRRKPLLNEFPLSPGRITIGRLSQSRNRHSLTVGGGEMLDAPLPFSGTSGVARLDTDVGRVLDVIMFNGLEHHYGIAYGDHREALHAYAADVGIPVIEL